MFPAKGAIRSVGHGWQGATPRFKAAGVGIARAARDLAGLGIGGVAKTSGPGSHPGSGPGSGPASYPASRSGSGSGPGPAPGPAAPTRGPHPGEIVVADLAAAALFALVAMLGAARPALTKEVFPGPVPARVLRVIDGDTLAVRARIWLGQDVVVRVRLNGVDTPELAGRCRRERDMAAAARTLVESRISGGEVVLRQIRYGKFAGRVVARVETAGGEDLAAALSDAGLARPYDGGRRQPWCAAPRSAR